MRYRFLEFELDTDQQALLRRGTPMPLRRQSYRVLLHLLQRAPAVVGKDELLDAIWGHQAISSSAVAQTVRELRDALDDDAEAPRAILTKHRVGYQFIARVDGVEDGEPASPTGAASHAADADRPDGTDRPTAPRFQPVRSGRLWPAALVLAAGLIGALVWTVWPERRPDQGWPDDAAAAAATSQALQALRGYRVPEAMAALARARARSDTPRLALTQARLHLEAGQFGRARELVAEVQARQASLARADVVHLEALQHELAGRQSRALDRYRVLNELSPDDLDYALALFEVQLLEHDRALAGTYQRIGDHESLPAARRLLLSAQAAGRDQDNPERIGAADAVLAVERADSNLAALARVERGNALRHLGRLDEARTELLAAAQALESGGLVRQAAEAWLTLLEPTLAQGALDTAADWLDALHRRWAGSGDGYLEGRILHGRGRIELRRGRDEQALAFFNAAVERHQAARNDDGMASALSAQSGALRRLGRLEEARTGLERALVIAERSDSGAVAAGVHGNLGNLHAAQARYDLAEQHLQQALQLFRRARDHRQEAVTLENLADLSHARGDRRAATDRQRQALARFRELDLAPDIARNLVALARSELIDGDLGQARTLAEEGTQLQRALDHPGRLARGLSVLADIEIRAANLAAARALLDEARSMAPDDAPVAAELATLAGRLAELADQPEAARRQFLQALQLREHVGDRGRVRESRLDLARIDLDRGQIASAEQAALAVAVEAAADGGLGQEREARLLLAQALQRMARLEAMERELAAVRDLLDRAPEFDAQMRWTLLRARIDLDEADARERLRWVHDQAQAKGQRLVALSAHADNAALGGLSPDELRAWQDEVRQRGLVLLLRPQVRLRR